ncbi:Uncharacterised protein [Mycobacterium tuberculosis]|uniref:Uncharacterized protein n=1 Tax=Mycobacterium tuberculosis TaxID=1773 RepID=A0A0U0QR57_MYCTX|nr:Uncharacterised protein [Mycobacterium tuberculosis]
MRRGQQPEYRSASVVAWTCRSPCPLGSFVTSLAHKAPGTVDVPGRAASTSVIDPTMRTPSAATKPRETLTACWPGCGT